MLWASAVAVSEMILEDPKLVQGKRVATVGCGLGLDGIVAALAGAIHGTSFQSDVSPLPLRSCFISCRCSTEIVTCHLCLASGNV